jgi:geranylgeranyl diphosphate synthase type II
MLPNWYTEYKKIIDNSVKNYLTEHFKSEKNPWLDIIKEASLYACKWWKRIRSVLALEFYLIFSNKTFEGIKNNSDIIKLCIALELLHWYSLVHDDLPAMDNDILRRWEETVWKKYWEANAILVWDLLNSLSFEVISEIWNISLIKYFWKAVWINWMLWGQVLDLYYENNPQKLNLENLLEVHNKKTWALIEISILWWIIIANLWLKKDNKKNKSEILKYKEFWEKIWLAFQVKDDLLDVEWSFEETGKSVGWENKWFVYFLWIDETKKYLNKTIEECSEIIKPLASEKLDFIVDYIANRKK